MGIIEIVLAFLVVVIVIIILICINSHEYAESELKHTELEIKHNFMSNDVHFYLTKDKLLGESIWLGKPIKYNDEYFVGINYDFIDKLGFRKQKSNPFDFPAVETISSYVASHEDNKLAVELPDWVMRYIIDKPIIKSGEIKEVQLKMN